MNESTVEVKISRKMMAQRFTPCNPTFIQSVCRGACCRSRGIIGGCLVAVHPTESEAIEAAGAVVSASRLLPGPNGGCPFQSAADHTCALHLIDNKPLGCVVSPFTLTPKDTLVVRNRYRLLKCYRGPGALPAYIAHRASLVRLFGEAQAAALIYALPGTDSDLTAAIPLATYEMLKDLDCVRRNTIAVAH